MAELRISVGGFGLAMLATLGFACGGTVEDGAQGQGGSTGVGGGSGGIGGSSSGVGGGSGGIGGPKLLLPRPQRSKLNFQSTFERLRRARLSLFLPIREPAHFHGAFSSLTPHLAFHGIISEELAYRVIGPTELRADPIAAPLTHSRKATDTSIRHDNI